MAGDIGDFGGGRRVKEAAAAALDGYLTVLS